MDIGLTQSYSAINGVVALAGKTEMAEFFA